MKKILVFLTILTFFFSIINISFGVNNLNNNCITQEIENVNKLIYSLDGKSYIYILIKDNGKQVVVKDGIEGKEYQEILNIIYSPDGKSFAYTIIKNGKYVVIKNGIESKGYNTIFDLKYSPDGKFLTYIITKVVTKYNWKRVLVKNGNEGKEYNSISNIQYSPDGKSFAYKGQKDNGKYVIIKDGIEGKEYDSMSNYMYGLNGKNLAYFIQKNNGKQVVIENGIEGKEYSKIIFLTRNGESFMYIASKDNGKQVVVKNGIEGKEYIFISPFKYSINTIYIASKDNGKQVLVSNGIESKNYKSINSFIDGKKLIYIVSKDNGKQVVVKDGIEGKEYKNIKKLYSLDGKNISYIATKDNGKKVIVNNGIEGREYEDIWNAIKYGSIGDIYTYIGVKNGKPILVKNGIENKKYDIIRHFIYSKNGKSFAYLAIKSNGKYVIINNGSEGKEYNYIGDFNIIFSKDGKINAYIATKNNGRKVVVINGIERKEYKNIGTLPYSLDGKNISYIATKNNGKKYLIIEDLIKKNCVGNNITNKLSGKKYNIKDGSKKIEKVKEILKNTNYFFKVNLGSGTKGSTYLILFKNIMVGYIYALDNGISMGEGWQGNGEVGTFYDKKNITVEEILKYFYKYNTRSNSVDIKNFNILDKKISFKKKTKNIRIYLKIFSKKKGIFLLNLQYYTKFINGGGWGNGKIFQLKSGENKLYYGDILYGDNGKTTITKYEIKYFECTDKFIKNICFGKRQIGNTIINYLNISTSKNYNIIENKQTQIKQKTNGINTNFKIKKSKFKLFKQIILSKKELNKSFKGRKDISTIDLIVKKLSKQKLGKLMGKLEKIDTSLVIYRKYKDMLDYLEAKVGVELLSN